MWRFINEMKIGDLVVVPSGKKFYIAEVVGEPFYDESKVPEDSAYRRNVKWFNSRNPIDRSLATPGLKKKMKLRQTLVNVTVVLDEIKHFIYDL